MLCECRQSVWTHEFCYTQTHLAEMIFLSSIPPPTIGLGASLSCGLQSKMSHNICNDVCVLCLHLNFLVLMTMFSSTRSPATTATSTTTSVTRLTSAHILPRSQIMTGWLYVCVTIWISGCNCQRGDYVLCDYLYIRVTIWNYDMWLPRCHSDTVTACACSMS